jgi:outer membrane protease
MSRQSTISRCTAVALAVALAAFAPATAGAAVTSQGSAGSISTQAGGLSFSLGASVGQVEGTAKELVFDNSVVKKFKLSELTWDITEVVMAGVQGSLGFGERFHANLGYWTALNKGNGGMVDRDWLYSPAGMAQIEPDADNWTHESKHPNTHLEKGSMLDLNLTGQIWQAGPFSVSGIAGYKIDDWKWSARGGTFVYSVDTFRDTVGSFPDNQKVIVYEQEYNIPYLGIGAGWSGATFAVDGRLLLSNWVSATDTDNHVLRSTIFEGDFSDGTFVGVGVSATWNFAPRWFATAALDYQSISEITGDVTMRSPQGDAVFRNGGGIAEDSTLLSLGAGFAF